MTEVHLVCEGDPGSLDERVLQFALGSRLHVNVAFFPTGGDASVKNARSFLERSLARRLRAEPASQVSPGPRIFSVQDRNYQPLASVQTVITAAAGQRSFVWARHEIENYLFEPSLLLQMFQSWKSANVKGAASLPQDLDAVEALLVELKRLLRIRHAGEMTREQLRRAGGWVQDSPPMPNLPDLGNADEEAKWSDLLQDIVKQERKGVSSMQTKLTEFEPAEAFAENLALLDDPSFVAQRRHIHDIGGHELVTALWKWLFEHQIRKLPNRQLSIETLEDQLYTAFEGAYEPDKTFQPDEFVLLAQRLQSHRDGSRESR